ncbi:MAG TPA: VOC family protein, partial [Gemmatimonadales bacterium]|nr:VOC family protein [Gemmatimonadales bacterium]
MLMFEGAAEEAMTLYASVFPGATFEIVERFPEGGVMRGRLTLAGHVLTCFDSPAKHAFTFTPSISLFVTCESAAEQEQAFARLAEGGQVLMPLDGYGFSTRFGWVNDRFGVSWQL